MFGGLSNACRHSVNIGPGMRVFCEFTFIPSGMNGSSWLHSCWALPAPKGVPVRIPGLTVLTAVVGTLLRGHQLKCDNVERQDSRPGFFKGGLASLPSTTIGEDEGHLRK